MTIALRVALATALVCVVVFTLIYAGLAHQSRTALLATIDTDVAGLADIYKAEGQAGLVNRLQERLDLAPTQGERPVYIVRAATGQTLIGVASEWPKLKPELSETSVATMGTERVLVRVTQLRGGVSLLVGRSMQLSDQGLNDVRLLFVFALALMVVSAFFIGNFAARRLRSRVATINDVFDTLQDGGTAARLDPGRDADELDALGSHVNMTLDRIERLIRAQRDVSDHIAHEVRTPLIVLNQRLETALSRCDDTEAIDALEAAQEQVRALLRLLDALLDIASAEAQRGDMRNLAEVDLSELARSLFELYAPSAEEAGVTLVADIADGIVIRADAMQMSRLMVNLLDNALKYGAAGKHVRLKVQPGPVITVEDEGPGVADTDRQRIFERYTRAAQNVVTGHGLGLALVAAIAARHNLTVALEDTHPDRVQRGAKFVVMPEVTG